MDERQKRDRPARNPGGMVCEECSEVFIGEEWHALCAICLAKRDNAHCRQVFEDNVKYGGMP